MNTNEIVGIGVMILCGVVLVVQILGLLLSIFKKMTTPNVEKLKTRRDKKALIKALRYKDKDVRYAAAEALGRLRWKPAKDETAGWYWMAKRDWDKCVALGALAVEPLSAALKDEEWDVRQAAARALGKIKDPRAVKPLIAALKDEKWDVRQAAAEALGEIGAPAVEPLIAALKGENKDVRQAAAAMLGRLGWQPGRDETAGWYWMVKGDWHNCVALGSPAVKPLIAALKDENSDVRKAAAEALGKIGDARAVEPLIAALKDRYSDVRQAASEALGKIGAPAVEPLIAALKDKDVRASATEALVKIGAPAVEPLIAALKDENKNVRQAAAAMLVRLGWQPGRDEAAGWYWMVKGDWHNCVALGSPAVKPLIAALKDAGWSVREAAAKALGEIKDPRAVEPLIAALKDESSSVRRAAAEALGDRKSVV